MAVAAIGSGPRRPCSSRVWVEARDWRGRVVVENERRAWWHAREVHQDIGAFGRPEHQRMTRDVQHDDVAPVVLVPDRGVVDDDRGSEKSPFCADLNHGRADRCGIRNSAVLPSTGHVAGQQPVPA